MFFFFFFSVVYFSRGIPPKKSKRAQAGGPRLAKCEFWIEGIRCRSPSHLPTSGSLATTISTVNGLGAQGFQEFNVLQQQQVLAKPAILSVLTKGTCGDHFMGRSPFRPAFGDKLHTSETPTWTSTDNWPSRLESWKLLKLRPPCLQRPTACERVWLLAAFAASRRGFFQAGAGILLGEGVVHLCPTFHLWGRVVPFFLVGFGCLQESSSTSSSLSNLKPPHHLGHCPGFCGSFRVKAPFRFIINLNA